MATLRERLGEAESARADLAAFARGHSGAVASIHAAVAMALEADSFDALAEVVNILMDNAEKHGGSDHSVVEVMRRDEESVDITVTDFGCGIPEDQRTTIFEWGKRGSESTGEGIGLHLAQRLMTEDGGSLRLAEDQGTGSSFVITLPRTRRSSENHLEMTL